MKRLSSLLLMAALPLLGMTKSERKQTVTSANIEITSEGAISLGSVFPDMGLTDPHSWVENDTLYVFCGHDESWRTEDIWRMNRWEIWSTTDLKTWTHRRDILPTDTYIGDKSNCWAGDICKRDGKFYWFFSNSHHNSGVMVSDQITGPYKDLLGKPLLDKGIIPGKPYDPEVFIENGVYTICFSANTYYMATLSEDMKSLATEPKPLLVTRDGKKVSTKDKSTLIKVGDWYYLLYGSFYATSKNLYGSYELQDNMLTGGHNSIFEWKGQYYLLYEFGESYMFRRGVGMKPIYFDNGKISVYKPKNSNGKAGLTTFDYSHNGWFAEKGLTSTWNKDGYIEGTVTEKGGYISSIPYLRNSATSVKIISFKLQNNTSSKRARVWVSTFDDKVKAYWQTIKPINWSEAAYADIEIAPNSNKMEEIEIDFAKFGKLSGKIRQIRIEPASDASSGSWKIDNLYIK